MMNNGHRHTKIQAYAHSQRQSKMITINYITGNIVHYTPLLSLGARHYGVVPLRKRLFAPAHFQIELNLFK
jgi:hypothetical protein